MDSECAIDLNDLQSKDDRTVRQFPLQNRANNQRNVTSMTADKVDKESPPVCKGLTPFLSDHPNWKHGLCGTPIYRSWAMTKNRCTNPNCERYKDYGGRGIKLCDRWMKFIPFLEDMGPTWQADLSLERIDVNGDYTKSNCRWATDIEQANNTRVNRLLRYNGKAQTIAAWSRELGISKSAITTRIYRAKMSDYDALTIPVRKQ